MRKPISPAATAELNAVLRRAAERMERRRRKGHATQAEADELERAVADAMKEDVAG